MQNIELLVNSLAHFKEFSEMPCTVTVHFIDGKECDYSDLSYDELFRAEITSFQWYSVNNEMHIYVGEIK